MADEMTPAAAPSRPSLSLPDIPVPGTKAKIPGWSLLVGAGAVVAWLVFGRKGATSSTTSSSTSGQVDASSGSAGSGSYDTAVSSGSDGLVGSVTTPPPAPPAGKSGSSSLAELQAQLAQLQQQLTGIENNIQHYNNVLAGTEQGKPGVDYNDKLDKAHHNAEIRMTQIAKLQDKISALGGTGGGTGGPRRNFGLGVYPERG